MHSLAGIMDHKADCVQSVACLFTIHAAVRQFQHYTCQWMYTFSGIQASSICRLEKFHIIWKRDLSLPLHGHLHEALCIIHEANCGLGIGGL